MDDYKARILADMLSQKLDQHLQALKAIEEYYRIQPGDLENINLNDYISKIRGIRKAMIVDAERIVELIEKGELTRDNEAAEDLYALAGYYVEGAYHAERRLFTRLGGFEEDLLQIELLRSALTKVMKKLE